MTAALFWLAAVFAASAGGLLLLAVGLWALYGWTMSRGDGAGRGDR